MGANERFIRRAGRTGRQILERMGEEIRLARVARGLSQAQVGRQAGSSRSKVGRIERADCVNVPLLDVVVVAAVVGLELKVHAYPVGVAFRDSAHAALLERLHVQVHPGLRWGTEVPLPNANDLRAWDATIWGPDFRIGVEAEMRVRDGQELERRIAAKKRDGGVGSVILLLADTRANRAFVREREQSLRASFPMRQADVLAALANGRAPGGDAMLLL